MGFKLTCAKAISSVSTWGLKRIFRRPAENFPGKIALYVDPSLIKDLSSKLACGSLIVCGTNGKTTVTNLIADTLEASGKTVICNRGGANLDSGIATALLQEKPADWGVFESDELWLAKVLPQLQADYVVLLNLFRDQLDRVGEIDVIQDSIIAALGSSPETILVYNADDPFCAAIALKAANRSIAFGIEGSIGLTQNSVADSHMCQMCSGMLEYAYHQYGQLGKYICPRCGFARPELDFAAQDVAFEPSGLSFAVFAQTGSSPVRASYSGAYMVYNLLAVAVATRLLAGTDEALQGAIDAFDPQNGRLQQFSIQGRSALLNLAKNPTGFNQNLKIILQDDGNKVVTFFVNDKEGDGHDISWLWDIDFEELSGLQGTAFFAGGIRKNDVQVRLKYADIRTELVDRVADVIEKTDHLPADTTYYYIANYTALPAVREDLRRMASQEEGA